MANRKIEVVPIMSGIILKNIESAGLSIRKLAAQTGRSERTIRNYLKKGVMPRTLVHEIDDVLRPKKNPVHVKFDATVYVSDDELDWLKDYICDDKCVLDSEDADQLWDLKGDTEFNGAEVCVHDICFSTSILMDGKIVGTLRL